MNSSIGSAHHYALCDASGKSVVVEYIENEMIVTDTSVVINFYLTAGEKYSIGSEQSHNRYETLSTLLSANGSVMTGQQVCEALAAVVQSNFADSDEGTQWSLVYDTDSLKVQFYTRTP